MKTSSRILLLLIVTIPFLLNSCSKDDNGGTNHPTASMQMEITYTGDITSQNAIITLLAADENTNTASEIVNENTGASSLGPMLYNKDLSASGTKLHSVNKVSYAKVMLVMSPKPAETTPENDLSITIKTYFNGQLADQQTFVYDAVFSNTTETKTFDYKVFVK